MDARDNVAVVAVDARPGDAIELANGEDLRATETIPRGGKVALSPIRAGEVVVRYGEEIGLATQDIAPGQHVHTHNLGGGQ